MGSLTAAKRNLTCTLLLVAAGCGAPATPPDPDAAGATNGVGAVAASGSADASNPATGVAKASSVLSRISRGSGGDRGDFRLRYEPTRDPDFRELQEVFRDSELFEETLAGLNETLKLPADVAVVLRECGEVNAFYDPEGHEISICYELVAAFAEQFFADVESEEEAESAGVAVAGATLFIFFHEAGHALIHLYDLPITGREEDAVDQLATLILLEAGEEGEDAALDAASAFTGESEEELDELAFWDEHSLDAQRFYNIVCWVYGSSPDRFEGLVEEEYLPVERAERCPGEYDQMSRAWNRLLDTHFKT